MKTLRLRDIDNNELYGLSTKTNSMPFPHNRITNWIWEATQLIERAIRQRRCHLCKCNILPGEAHLALRTKTHFTWTFRQNMCVFCLESIVRSLKRSIKGSILGRKKVRKLEMLLDEL